MPGVLYGADAAPLVSARVEVVVEERLASGTTALTFDADGQTTLVVDLPDGAAVVALRWRQGDGWIEGGAVPASEPPLPPGGDPAFDASSFAATLPAAVGTLDVEVEWQVVLAADRGELALTVPLSDEGASPMDGAVSLAVALDGDPSITPTGAASPGLATWVGTLSDAAAATVTWAADTPPMGLGIATYRPAVDPFTGEADPDGYALVWIRPGPPWDGARVETVTSFVVDTSSSMEGAAIEAAGEAAGTWIRALRPEDRFALITYSSVARAWRARAVAADDDAADDAIAWLARQRAMGLSDPEEALVLALRTLDDTVQQTQFFSCTGSAGASPEAPPVRSAPVVTEAGREVRVAPYVILLTDGGASVGETDPDAIADAVDVADVVGATILAVGVGPDVDLALLERLAAAHRGEVRWAPSPAEVGPIVAELRERVADPMLVRPTVTGDAVHAPAPAALPDVAAGREVLLAFRYAHPGPAELELAGVRGAEDLREVYEVELAAADGALPAVALAWAAARVRDLDAAHAAGDHAVYGEIEALVAAYGVASEVVSLGYADVTAEAAYAASADVAGCGCDVARGAAGLGPLAVALGLALARRRRAALTG